MYALRRIIAYVIDTGLILTPVGAFMGPVNARLTEVLPAMWQVYAGFFGWVLSMGVPVLVIGTLVGLTGRTPGKLLMFLRVEARRGEKPGVPAGLLREVVKAVAASMIFGALFALYGIITSGRTFYDDWLGLEVEDLKQSGLTDVQKNWRKHMREQRKREAAEERS